MLQLFLSVLISLTLLACVSASETALATKIVVLILGLRALIQYVETYERKK